MHLTHRCRGEVLVSSKCLVEVVEPRGLELGDRSVADGRVDPFGNESPVLANGRGGEFVLCEVEPLLEQLGHDHLAAGHATLLDVGDEPAKLPLGRSLRSFECAAALAAPVRERVTPDVEHQLPDAWLLRPDCSVHRSSRVLKKGSRSGSVFVMLG